MVWQAVPALDSYDIKSFIHSVLQSYYFVQQHKVYPRNTNQSGQSPWLQAAYSHLWKTPELSNGHRIIKAGKS